MSLNRRSQVHATKSWFEKYSLKKLVKTLKIVAPQMYWQNYHSQLVHPLAHGRFASCHAKQNAIKKRESVKMLATDRYEYKMPTYYK